ncbi:phospholipase D-like domain-containing protein [Trinickia sp.]|uniref:phospholipase D-like domain-containing protein n=1 Tax=Trinickia sp. TaxID=2571163 RepID=UPI003F804F0F
MAEHLKTQNPVEVAIDEAGRNAQGTVQWFVENRPAKDGRPAIKDAPPIYAGNRLAFMICGEEGFAAIARDIRAAKSSVDIICWGFDPGMELERSGAEWKRGQTYGELLEQITTRKDNPVTVRLLIWYDQVASTKQNSMPGYTDNVAWTWNLKVRVVARDTPYANSNRHRYCVDWWARHLPRGSGSGANPRLQVVLRSVASADAVALLSTSPAEEDMPSEKKTGPAVEAIAGITEANLLEDYPTHHQKPVLIDYAYDGGSKAVGYVMGLNSVTDFWDRCGHEVDDPKRERWGAGKVKDELGHEKVTEGLQGPVAFSGAKATYQRTKPYQDYACRLVGPALERLHQNFERGWKGFAPQKWQTREFAQRPPNIPMLPPNPAHRVQIVRTQPDEREKSIKELYFQATSFARNYIYIENQYFFYPEFARHLKKERAKFCRAWARLPDKPMIDVPVLHLFIVIPHPEDEGMVPRTFDTLTEFGASSTMPEQGKYIDRGETSQDYRNAKSVSHTDYVLTDAGAVKVVRKRKVLDRPSLEQLQKTLGLKVSVARLRTSGLDANNKMAYREIYIHSKLMLIDDVFVTVGSANISQRSMSVDSEINIAATGQATVSELRQRVFALHSGGLVSGSNDREKTGKVFGDWEKRMQKNRDIQLAGIENLRGFLLPFEDHRASATMHASVTIPSSCSTAVV